MKQIKFWPVLGLFISGFSIQSMTQEPLPEVVVVARNYKYIKSVNNKSAAQPVKQLEWKAAEYDVKNSEFYEDDYDNYSIKFYLPQGYVLAMYDSSGKLMRTAERFKNVALPRPVSLAIAQRYPNWAITGDVYRVKYEQSSESNMVYKLILKNGNKRLRVKINEKGEFID